MAKEQTQKPRTSTKNLLIIGYGVLLVLVIILAVSTGACLGGESTETNTPRSTPTSYPTVVYEITGSARYVSVTLSNSTGDIEQYSNVSVSHRYTYDKFTNDFLSISAQNLEEHGGVTVTIYIDDEVFKTSSSTGAYAIASASGTK